MSCGRGDDFYLPTKKEAVSEKKELVLYDGKSFVKDASSVRSRLKKSVKGAIRVVPADIPEGCRLYVQSTSSNRKLEPGTCLVRTSSGGEEEDLSD